MKTNPLDGTAHGLIYAAWVWTVALLVDLARADMPTFAQAAVRLGVYALGMVAFARWRALRGRPAPRLVSRSPVWQLVFDPPAWLRLGLGHGVGFFAGMTLWALHDGQTLTLGGRLAYLAFALACWTGIEYARTRPWTRQRGVLDR